jgi:hypothetical protein
MNDLFDFLDRVYSLFGFNYKLELSTRPEGFLGKLEDWEKAEAVRDLHYHFPSYTCLGISLSTATRRSPQPEVPG